MFDLNSCINMVYIRTHFRFGLKTLGYGRLSLLLLEFILQYHSPILHWFMEDLFYFVTVGKVALSPTQKDRKD